MPAEPTASPTASPQGAIEVQAVQIDTDKLLAIQACMVVAKCFQNYLRALKVHAKFTYTPEANIIHAKMSKKSSEENCPDRLATIQAMLALLAIYISSRHVTEAERGQLNMPYVPSRVRDDAPTRAAIADTIHAMFERSSTKAACLAETNRIVELAILYGLVETDTSSRANHKPLVATDVTAHPCASV